MSKKKQTYLITGIILTIIYLFLVFYFIHIRLVMTENPDMNIAEGLNEGFKDMTQQPFAISPLPSGTIPIIFFITFAIAFIVFLVVEKANSRAHYNTKTAQGDAKFLEGKEFVEYEKKFTEPFGQVRHDGKNNMILADKMFMSMDNRGIADHNNHNSRNMNVFAIGGSGAGKTFGLVGPNILQANCSYVITDPSGGLFQDYGYFLEREGYKVKCFNLDHMEKGNHYNPFNYIHSDKDVEVLVTTLIANTNPPEKTGGDPFWEKSETALLTALIAYLFHYAEPQYQNFSNVMNLLRAADINENDDTAKSPLDLIFEDAEEKDPDGFAIKEFKIFKMGAGKTMKSILISTAVRLQAFDLVDVADLTDTDDIDLDSIGDEKTALFIIIPTGEKTFNFLAALMYSQLFQRLYSYAENSAQYSQLVVDNNGELIRTFRAEGPIEAEKAKERAYKFLNKAQTATIKEDKNTGLFYVYSQDNKILKYSNDKHKAEEFLHQIKNGRVINNYGNRLPIHVRFLQDEFANTGRIPDYSEKVATIRKYEISVTIILQSLQQMKNLYEKEWEAISGNCDNTIYLGGGADTVTTEWMSKLIGKETRILQSTTYNSGNAGGSNQYSAQGVELLSPSQLRTMDESECIVLQKSLPPYKGKKFPATKHHNWKYVSDTENYIFNGTRSAFLHKESIKAGQLDEEQDAEPIVVIPETKEKKEEREKKNKEEAQKAEEFRNNKDINREPIAKQPTEIKTDDDSFAKEEMKIKDEMDVQEISESLIESDDLIDEEFIFEAESRNAF